MKVGISNPLLQPHNVTSKQVESRVDDGCFLHTLKKT